ncbi:hypothetical protein, partial [Achromobacter sp.]|uniref:hypothetical protein n=1 Tax=Achromobacter sp. TaxID=134375 RepID=UPI003C7682C1
MHLDAAGILDARPRARRVAWWAVLASCALHAVAAGLWWRERIEPAGMRAARAPELTFFVDLLPAKSPPAPQEHTAQDAPAFGSGPVQPARIDMPPV